MSPLRSLLFAPADRSSIGGKLARSGADAVVIDLEDAVAPSNKDDARGSVGEVVRALRDANPEVFVRINPLGTPWFEDDLEAISRLDGVGIVVPKVEDPGAVMRIDERVRSAGQRAVRLIVGLETVRGVLRSQDILVGPVAACYFGAEDYIADLGGRRTSDGAEVLYARSSVAMHARLAGIAAIDQAVLDVRDDAAFCRDASTGRNLGYVGKLCIHPAQVAAANAAFGASSDELQAAQRIVDAYADAHAGGVGVIVVDGRMVDEPVARQARETLARNGSGGVSRGSQSDDQAVPR